jgi:uncharacterized protein DUF1015
VTNWIQPIRRGWVVRGEVPGPDVDEFADPTAVSAALARPDAARRTLLAVQHPHRTPAAIAAGLDLPAALPAARSTLSMLLRNAYRPVTDVVAPYQVDGPDGTAHGVLCVVDPAAVAHGQVRQSEQVYSDVVAERAAVLAGLGHATSAAMLVPVGPDVLTAAVRTAVGDTAPAVSTVDSGGRRHRLWLLDDGADLLAVAGATPLLVADGNHRVAAATAAGLGGMLALVTSGPALRVAAFHRVLTGTGRTAADLTTAWRHAGLDVREGPAEPPTTPGTVVVRCPDRTLVVRLPAPAGQRPVIDHDVVEDLLLRTALGIDPAGPEVRPLPAGREPDPDADAVLQLAPVPLADVLAVHEQGRTMPRKSTYFTPKPRSGLLIADLR